MNKAQLHKNFVKVFGESSKVTFILSFVMALSLLSSMAIIAVVSSCNNQPDTGFKIYANNLDAFEDFTVRFVPMGKNDSLVLNTTIKNGAFSFEGDASVIKIGDLLVLNADEKKVISRMLVVEPGTLELVIDSKRRLRAEGDNLNTIAIDSWRFNKKADSLYDSMMSMRDLPASNKDHPDYSQYIEEVKVKSQERLNVIRGILHNLAFNSNNESVPLIVALNRAHGMTVDEYNQIVSNTASTEENAYLLNCLKEKIDMITRKEAKTGENMLGKVIEDFSVNDINGEQKRLSDVTSRNKYTLVEFWASWCAPCRAEIPYMKKVYKSYKDKGFEIFAYSLDTKEEAWIKASEEENLDWINTSDLLRDKSPIVESFAVYGIPRNYLVDNEGKIVAIDLRGQELEEKVKELL